MNKIRNCTASILLFIIVGISFAQAPDSYYNTAESKSKYELKTALYNIIKDHTRRTYHDLWTDFGKTDLKAGDTVWGMYSDCIFILDTNQCGSGADSWKVECDCYNREHSMPKSWFGGPESTPMYTDLFHLYPADGKNNTMRSNNPFGEVDVANYTTSNGSKRGTSATLGYTGTVFEPIDEYKGDFARTYFYMATRYEDLISTWESPMFNGTADQVYTEWAMSMLLRWHKSDPVSQKEIDRNNAVYLIQNNRNPFIDFPNLVDKIWANDNTAFDGTNTSNSPSIPAGTPTHMLYELRDGEGKVIRNEMIRLTE